MKLLWNQPLKILIINRLSLGYNVEIKRFMSAEKHFNVFKIPNYPRTPSFLSNSRLSISTSIEIENTPNPNAKMFYPMGCKLLPEQAPESVSFDHNTIQNASKPTSQLVENLLNIEGIYSVLLCKNHLTVVKERSAKWNILESQIQKKLMEYVIAGLLPSFNFPDFKKENPQISSHPMNDEDSELEEIIEAIQVLIDTRARPMVMEDGGDIEFIKFDDQEGIVWVYMKGACEGCPSSTLTLQEGLSTMLRYFVPEVKGVQQCDENGDPLILDDHFE